MATDDIHIVVSGRMRTIEFAVLADGKMPAKAFYESLDARDRDRLFVVFAHVANEGEVGIKSSVFGKEEKFPPDINGGNGRLWAFKDKTHRRPGGGIGMLRIGCFRMGNRWILLDGFWKPPQSEWPETQITRLMCIVREEIALEKQRNKKRGE